MSDKRDPAENGHGDELPSVEQVARLDAFLDQLLDERRPDAQALTAQEVQERMLAAQLRLAREEVEAPTPEFLRGLEQAVERAVAQEKKGQRRLGVSRGGFLRAAITLAGGAGLGVAGVEGVAAMQDMQRPHELVMADNERWYDIAADGEVPPGGVKPFNAGGVIGFLLNDDGQLHAVSAICTHMGCRLKPDPTQADLHCLCHGSRFTRRGNVAAGMAPTSLPAIKVQIANGRVYALGTRETV